MRLLVDCLDGGVSAFGFPLACVPFEGETLGDGGGDSDHVSGTSNCEGMSQHTVSSSALGSSFPFASSFGSLCCLLFLLFIPHLLVSIGPCGARST